MLSLCEWMMGVHKFPHIACTDVAACDQGKNKEKEEAINQEPQKFEGSRWRKTVMMKKSRKEMTAI